MKYVALGAGVLLLFVAIFVGSLYIGRSVSKFDEATRRQTQMESQTFQDGMNGTVADLCRQYRASTADQKAVLAEEIRAKTDHYTGPLTDSNHSCVSEIQ